MNPGLSAGNVSAYADLAIQAAPPDLTQGGKPDNEHRWTLGATGAETGVGKTFNAQRSTLNAQVSDTSKGTVKVFILAGQSNMEGHAGVQTLDQLGKHPTHAYLLKKIKNTDGSFVVRDDVFVSYKIEDEQIKRPLSVGMGASGEGWFGPELMFGIEMGEHLKEPVLLIKTCWGGHSLYGNFRPPSAGKPAYKSDCPPEEIGASYHKMVKEVRECLAKLDTDFPQLKGLKTELSGFVWFQGWNDMCADEEIKQQVYDEYCQNFVHLVQDLRAEFKMPNLPIVIGELGVNGKNGDENMMDFRAAQSKIARCSELKSTLGYVRTAPFWYSELDEQASKLEAEEARVREAVEKRITKNMKGKPVSKNLEKMEELINEAAEKAQETDAAYLKVKKEADKHICHWGCHYYGSARVYCMVGYSLAEAMKPLLKGNTEAPLYQLRPNPEQEEVIFGNVGVSGLLVNFYKGVVMKVDKTLPNTPAAGQFKSGQIVTGINGIKFSGKNPYVILGKALTLAEATDGVLVFHVRDSAKAPEKKVKISIPVLGAYSDTWPLNCEKSKKIIRAAAQFYSTDKAFKEEYFEEKGIGGALACLFLLSTGDDSYLPFVKEYFGQFPSNVKEIGEHTWHNGYNGIACAEYYLRTGDKSVLPILQYYCDDAQQRQSFGCGWGHWGNVPGPGYVAGGLMNPAGAQVLTTLLLAQECGVKVDKKTMLSSLRFFYRFAGHGTVPYGDHRSEGGLGSNGKDGMIAAAMQVAAGATSDVTIYKQAQNCLSMSMLASYPVMIQGHGDEGRGDALWRGLSSAYMLGPKPEAYHEAMNNLRWYYDLCRRPSGSLGVATCPEFDDDGSGAGVALTYTAPLKTLRLTGAPPSKYAKQFKLPKALWGTQADEAFLSIEKNEKYEKYGKPEPIDVPFYKYGSAYAEPTIDFKNASKAHMLKNVYHDNYMIRCQAAKALRRAGGFMELEMMLEDIDPRVRRAALDGMIDYNYWFGMGEDLIKQEDVSPKMIAALEKMLSDPAESLWVVDGALMAMSTATPETINKNLALIMPWLKHEDWWLRESAFRALHGMRTDGTLFPKVLPAMLEMAAAEYHTMPRERCMNALGALLDAEDNASRPQLLAGLLAAFEKTEIKPDRGAFITSAEGSYNAKVTVDAYLKKAPETGLRTAEMMRKRLGQFGVNELVELIGSPNSRPEDKPSGLYTTLEKLDAEQREKLATMLYTDYRLELVKRLKTTTEDREALIDTLIDLKRLKDPAAGWHVLGDTKPADRMWRFISFDPQPKDVMHPREKHRFRDVTLPRGLEEWYQPEFDDKAWKSGKAPIGVGVFKGMDPYNDAWTGKTIPNQSAWGKGEFLLMRTTFKLESVAWDFVRIRVLMKQGYHLYLNGEEIGSYGWWKDTPVYSPIMLDSEQAQKLKKGINVLALYGNVEYLKGEPFGQADVYLEGLKKTDLE